MSTDQKPVPFQPISKHTTSKDGITAAVTMFINEKGVLDCIVSTHIDDEVFKRMSQQNASDEPAT